MRKRSYKSVEIQAVNVNKLVEGIGGGRAVFAVDVAKEVQYATVVNEKGAVLGTVRWKQPQQTAFVVEWLGNLGASRVEVVMEPSGTYGDALRGRLLAAGYEVYRVSGKRVHDAAELYDGVPSHHDAKSAAIIAKMHLEGASEPWPLRSKQERELLARVQLMDLYGEQLSRGRGKLEALLARHWPELGELLDLGSATLLALLSEFGSPQEVARRSEEARALMRVRGGHLLKEEKIEAVLETARTSSGLVPLEAERELLMRLAEELTRQNTLAREAEKQMLELVQDDAPLLAMSTAVGKGTAAAITAVLGSPKNFDKAAQYTKSMGINLKEKSSGKSKGVAHITKRGNSTARRLLFLAAMRQVKDEPIVRAWYQKQANKPEGSKIKALVAVMRKLASALWHLGVHGGSFDASRLFDVRRLGLEAAAAGS